MLILGWTRWMESAGRAACRLSGALKDGPSRNSRLPVFYAFMRVGYVHGSRGVFIHTGGFSRSNEPINFRIQTSLPGDAHFYGE